MAMAVMLRPQRQTDYHLFPVTTTIVIDNGTSCFRIGWAGETNPRIIFHNVVQRPRHKTTCETVTVVGHHDPALLKYFDCTRSGPRSAFENDVVCQFDLMEYIFDFGFDRLGANGSLIDHPILITECVCNPVHSRGKMAELLFETYGVPSLAFGVDAAFSYSYNQQLGICDKDGLAISSGFNTSHVIPFVDGEPIYKGSCRTNVGGYHITDYLRQLLSLKYPYHTNNLTWEKVENLKVDHCYISQEYASDAQLFQKGTKEAEEKTKCWQLPWVPPPVEVTPSQEELARKAAIREKQCQRLREMAEAKRSSKIHELQNELHGLEFLLQQLEEVDEDDVPYFLKNTGYFSKHEIEFTLLKVEQSLRKVRGEQKGEQLEVDEDVETSSGDKCPLLGISDDVPTAEQVKETQLFPTTVPDSQQQGKRRQRCCEEEAVPARGSNTQRGDEQNMQSHESYLGQMHTRYKVLSEKVEQRKRLKSIGCPSNGTSLYGGIGRGERLNAAQRERMRLLTSAAFDRGKGEDTFGSKDEDWQLYKLMSRDNDPDEDQLEEDEAELLHISSKLQEMDPTFIPKPEVGLGQPAAEIPQFRPLTKEDFQIFLGVECFRCPEILFHPDWIGIDQAGLDEMVGVSIRRLQLENQGLEFQLTNSVLLTGGSCLLPSMSQRLEAGIRMIRPSGLPIRVARALDPLLDAWRGASLSAARTIFPAQLFDRVDYYEKGEDWLCNYQFKYTAS